MISRVEVRGVEELKARLLKFEEEAIRTFKAAIKAGSLIVVNAARQTPPCPYKTGNLMRSIHPEVTTETADRVVVEVGTDVDYSVAQEFLYGHPYMRPALEENRRGVENTARKVFKRAIEGAGR